MPRLLQIWPGGASSSWLLCLLTCPHPSLRTSLLFGSSCTFPAPALESAISLCSPGSFSGERCWCTKTWVLGVLAVEESQLPSPLSTQVSGFLKRVVGTLQSLMLLGWFLVAFIPKTAQYSGNGTFSELRVWTTPSLNLAWPSRATARAVCLKQSLEDRREAEATVLGEDSATRQSIWKMQLLCSSHSSCPRGDPDRWRCFCFRYHRTQSFSFLGNKGFVLIQFLRWVVPKWWRRIPGVVRAQLNLEMFAFCAAYSLGSENCVIRCGGDGQGESEINSMKTCLSCRR